MLDLFEVKNPHQLIKLAPTGKPVKLPFGCVTIEEALKKFIDLRGPINKKVIKNLAPFAASGDREIMEKVSTTKELQEALF